MDGTPVRHILRFCGRRRPWLSRVLAAGLVLALLASGQAHRAAADTTPSTCVVNGLLLSPCPADANGTLPPDLLNTSQLSQGLYAVTPDQLQSLQNLEQEAVSNTLHDHGLPAGDATAAQSWGRADAEAELFALLVQDIQTTPVSRTTDQQNAIDWLAAVVQRSNVQAAQDAGLEYVKWAGLDQSQYQHLLATQASTDTLQSFFNVTPLNYNNPTNPGASTGGYCVYRPPAPYQSEYSDASNQSCVTPCTSSAGCIPTGPTIDQFVKWGESDADYAAFNSSDFAQTSHDIAIGLGAGAGIGAGVTGLVIGTALFTSLIGGVGAPSGVIGSFLLPYLGVGLTTAAVAGLVVIVLAAIAVGVVDAIDVFNAAAVPGQLASLIASAPTTTPDLGTMLADSNQMTNLFSLFVGATLPTPKSASCDNSLLINQTGTITQTGIAAPCLNAPAIPAPARSDPAFAIQAKGATTTTDAASLTWADTTTGITHTARLSGHWFVDQETSPDGTTAVTQTLRMHYTDWNGQGQTAWLLGDPTDGYKFLDIADLSASGTPLDPSTCQADQTCAYTSTIDYVGTDGHDYAAAVIPSLAPAVAPSASGVPVEGSAVTFTANGSSPLGLPLTYQWRFEQPSSFGGVIICDPSGNCTTQLNYTAPVTGTQATYTWQTSGTFHVQLTATDSLGKQTVDTFTVAVADVPPTLALDSVEETSDPFGCTIVLCDEHTVPLGSVTALHGTITHAGSADTETADINWGDGTPDDSNTLGSLVVTGHQGDLSLDGVSITQISLADTHTYAAAGTYPVTVTVRDQAGATAVVTTTETVQATPSVTWPTPAPITYGTALDATQLDATASVTGTPSVPGAFAYSADGSPVSASDQKVLAAGPHTLTVQFTPSNTTLYTTPDPVAVPLTVTAAALTLTADDQRTVYGQALPPFTVTPHGLVNGDTLASLQGTLSVTTTATQTSAPGTYTLTPGGLSSPNYSISYGTGTLTIAKDASTVALSSSANPAPFGQALTLTANVGAAAPGSGTPTGSVTFFDGATPLGTATLANGQASLSTATLLGGTHQLSVRYGGDTDFSAGTSAALAQAITFSRTLSGTVSGPQTVHSGETVLIDGTVNGPLTVQAGGSVALVGAHVNGPLSASGAGAVALCGSTVGGAVAISGSSGFVRLGAGSDDAGVSCAGDTLQGPLSLSGNKGGVEVEDATIVGPLSLTNTSGGASGADSAAPELEGNTIGGALSCAGNTPAPTADGQPNTVSGPKSGQCTGL